MKIKQGKKSKAAGHDFVETQNNFYQSDNFKPLKLSESQKISVLKPNLLFRIFLYTIPLSILLFFIGLSIFNWFDVYFNLFTVPGFAFAIAALLSTYLFVYGIAINNKYFRDDLYLFENGAKSRGKIINFENVRSILKIKTISGYTIYIYKVNEIMPIISFDVSSLHEANAIYELIIHYIQDNKNAQKN